jgi:hypothetical protein
MHPTFRPRFAIHSGKEHNFELSGVRLVQPARLYSGVLARKSGAWFNKESAQVLLLHSGGTGTTHTPDSAPDQPELQHDSQRRRRLLVGAVNDVECACESI